MDEPDDDEVMRIMMENGFGGPKVTKPKGAAPPMDDEDAIMASIVGNQAQPAQP